MHATCRRLGKKGLHIAALALLAGSAFGQSGILAYEASNHMGEYSKVCGQVASTHFAYRSRGAPTFISLDRPYPSHVFTVLIRAEDRSKFGAPENRYANQHICVSGMIQVYRGVPEIILRDPRLVEIKQPSHQSFAEVRQDILPNALSFGCAVHCPLTFEELGIMPASRPSSFRKRLCEGGCTALALPFPCLETRPTRPLRGGIAGSTCRGDLTDAGQTAAATVGREAFQFGNWSPSRSSFREPTPHGAMSSQSVAR